MPNARNRRPVGRSEGRSSAGDALSLLVVQVLRLAGLLADAGDTLAAPAGQTSARWRVLAAAEGSPSSVADIARMLGLARQSVQRIADLLEHDGLVEYRDNPAHLRAKLVSLTPSGRKALRLIQDAQRVWANEIGAVVGEKDLRSA